MQSQAEEAQASLSRVSRSKIVKTAITYGLIIPGWTLEDYIRDAAAKGGYATVQIWGEQGSGKSNRLLQEGYWVYQDWDRVLENILFKPSAFVSKLKAIPKGKRVPWIGWDDIGCHMPSSTFRTDINQYQAVDAVWTVLRVKASVITLTIPNITRLVRNIKDNISFEVFLGKNQTELVERIVRLPSFSRLESVLKKVLIEGPRPFRLFDVPKDVFKQYWDMRLNLTEEALDMLEKTSEPESLEGLVPVFDVAEALGLSPNTIQQMISRGVVGGRKVGSLLYLEEKYVPRLKKIYEEKDAFKYRGH